MLVGGMLCPPLTDWVSWVELTCGARFATALFAPNEPLVSEHIRIIWVLT